MTWRGIKFVANWETGRLISGKTFCFWLAWKISSKLCFHSLKPGGSSYSEAVPQEMQLVGFSSFRFQFSLSSSFACEQSVCLKEPRFPFLFYPLPLSLSHSGSFICISLKTARKRSSCFVSTRRGFNHGPTSFFLCWQHSFPIDFWLLSLSYITPPCSIGAGKRSGKAECLPKRHSMNGRRIVMLRNALLSFFIWHTRVTTKKGESNSAREVVPLVSADELPIGWRMSLYKYCASFPSSVVVVAA